MHVKKILFAVAVIPLISVKLFAQQNSMAEP